MCKRILVMLLVVVVVSVCGCNASKGICDDTAGTAMWLSNAINPMVDKANARDAKVQASGLARYHAEQAGRFASYDYDAEEDK